MLKPPKTFSKNLGFFPALALVFMLILVIQGPQNDLFHSYCATGYF